MALTPLHVRDVCMGGLWSGGTTTPKICKYIDHISRSDGKHVAVCTKRNSGAFAALEKKRAKWGGHGYDGDNCAGYLYLQYQEQGYDLKKP